MSSSRRGSESGRSYRNVVVFAVLLGGLTLTSVLLLALSPAPLTPDAASSMFAIDAPHSLEVIFDTRARFEPGRWKYVYVHHSKTAGGNALSLGEGGGGVGDHFVIGNGDGLVNGEVQIGQRWVNQQTAAPPAGARQIDPACISICLIGDFDTTAPTAVQLRRLEQLIQTLQGRCHITHENVILDNRPTTAAGVGRNFPISALREQLLP